MSSCQHFAASTRASEGLYRCKSESTYYSLQIGTGIQGVQVEKMHYENNTATNVFILYRNDATSDDFSVRKCVANLFPKYAAVRYSSPQVR